MRFRFGINTWKAIQALMWAVFAIGWGESVQLLRCTFIGGFVVRHRALCRSTDFSIFFFISCLLQDFKITPT